MEVLAAFIREHSREQWPVLTTNDAPMPERTTRPDVQVALTVVGRRDTTHDRQPIDLTRADLTRGDLTLLDVTRAFDLTHAFLKSAILSSADLTFANLDGAYLDDADLSG